MINIGDKYNDWEVIGKADRDRYYICRCICGTIREVQDYSLTSGNSKSCGKNHDLMIKAGDRFNSWEVIGPAEKKNYYTCRCDCGKIKDVLKYQLTSGKSKGCGHQNHVRTHHLEEQTFGVWKVLEYIGDQKYRCECTVCGKQRDILWYRLTEGYTKGCNHSIQEIHDLKGKVFGRLKVISYAGRKQWLCECECGNRKIIRGTNLLNESTKSCGCLSAEKTMQKDYILSKIEEYKAEHNSNPSLLDMCNLLELGKNQVRRYIERYDLEDYLDKTFDSCQEKEIYDFIKTFYSGKIELHNREILSGQEIDIYLPEIKLGVEFNGDYWHSELFKEQTYHQNKVLDALNKGINVYSIFECEYKLFNDYILNELKKIIEENGSKVNNKESLTEEIEVNLGKEDCISYLNNGYDMTEVIAPTSVWIYKHEPIRDLANFIKTMNLTDKSEDEKIEALYNLGAFRIFNCGKAKLKLKQ